MEHNEIKAFWDNSEFLTYKSTPSKIIWPYCDENLIHSKFDVDADDAVRP